MLMQRHVASITSSKMCSRNLAFSLALIIALVPLAAVALPHHSVAKRSSFFDIECKGQFNKAIFYRLDRICEDCYSLFREPQILSFCKEECFGTDYFLACVEALVLDEETEKFMKWREMLGKK
ncbi:ion transport peptide isoform X2 [Ochlerotatus camptorhynchus]|uniref:ion transport peptide isoform X2 n=1 Tax=Ochlerotatus camptorhynchus TaxID=644619 RepID=UPI0031E34914